MKGISGERAKLLLRQQQPTLPTELVTETVPDLFRVLSCLEFVIGSRMAGKRVLEVRSKGEIQQKGRDFNVGLGAGSLPGRFISNNVCPRFNP